MPKYTNVVEFNKKLGRFLFKYRRNVKEKIRLFL